MSPSANTFNEGPCRSRMASTGADGGGDGQRSRSGCRRGESPGTPTFATPGRYPRVRTSVTTPFPPEIAGSAAGLVHARFGLPTGQLGGPRPPTGGVAEWGTPGDSVEGGLVAPGSASPARPGTAPRESRCRRWGEPSAGVDGGRPWTRRGWRYRARGWPDRRRRLERWLGA